MLFITQAVFGYFIKKLDGVVVQVVIYMIVLFSEIAWVEFEHNMMKKKMIKSIEITTYNLQKMKVPEGLYPDNLELTELFERGILLVRKARRWN